MTVVKSGEEKEGKGRGGKGGSGTMIQTNSKVRYPNSGNALISDNLNINVNH